MQEHRRAGVFILRRAVAEQDERGVGKVFAVHAMVWVAHAQSKHKPQKLLAPISPQNLC